MLQKWKCSGFQLMLLGLMMTIALASSCRSKPVPPREALQKAIEQELEVTTSETESLVQFSLMMDTSEFIDPETEVVLGLLENITLHMKAVNDIPAMMSSMQGRLDVGGMLFHFDILTTNEVLALKVPALATLLQEPRLQQGYIVLRMEDLMSEVPEAQSGVYEEMVGLLSDHQRSLKLTRIVLERTLEALEDNVLEDLGEVTIEIGNDQEKVRQIAVHIGETELRALALAYIDLFSDEEMRDFLFEMDLAVSPEISRETFETEMNKMIEEVKPVLDEMMDAFFETVDMEQSSFILTLFLNNEHQVLRTHFAGNAFITPEPGRRVNAVLDITSDTLSRNETVSIEIPEMTSENTMDIMELLWLLMFAF
ncbi:MAG: hypothetical protein SCK57_09395 [Bacillota bacterium]|nr:hypothetical protein [Bacillota bacterium]MDW7677862.1 hypothetical protein [Bacillota bacterium]